MNKEDGQSRPWEIKSEFERPQPGSSEEDIAKSQVGAGKKDIEKFRIESKTEPAIVAQEEHPEQTPPYEMPDIRMEFGAEDEAKRKSEEEYQAQSQERYRAGYALTEVLRTSESPRAIGLAAMEYMKRFEDIRFSTQNFRSPYDLGRVIQEVQDRAFILSIPVKDLLDKEEGWGVISSLDMENLTAKVDVAGFALGERNKKIEKRVGYKKNKEGKIISEDFREYEMTVPYIGSDDERKAVATALNEARAEINIEGVIHVNYLFHEKNSENLGARGLSEVYLHDQLTGEAMEAFWNLSPLWKKGDYKTEGGTEIVSRGHMVHLAERLWDVAVGLSEKPDELNSYRERPGWQELFPGSTKEKPSEAEKTWVGDVNKWLRGYKPDGTPVKDNEKGFRMAGDLDKGERNDLRDENEAGSRGFLAEHGNVCATSTAKTVEEIRERIRRFLGGGEDAPLMRRSIVEWAEEQAFRVSRPWGIVDNRGWEIYITGEKDQDRKTHGVYRLQMDMGPGVGSDWQKIITPMLYPWKNKQWPRRRDAGPIYTRARYKKFMVSLPETLSYKVKIKIENPDGTFKEVVERRTLQELTWGYKDETYILEDGSEKKYFNFGEIPWAREFGRYPGTIFFLKPFMVAREKVGVYDLTRKANWTAQDLYEMTHHDWWEQFMKRIEVAFPLAPIARGAFKGKDKDELDKKQYKLWEGIIKGTWDGFRSSKLYKSLREERIKVGVPGTPILVGLSTIDEVQKVVKDVMGIELDTEVIPLKERQKNRKFWEDNITEYLYPYPEYIEIG